MLLQRCRQYGIIKPSKGAVPWRNGAHFFVYKEEAASMNNNNRASTGIKGFDDVIDMLRLEDNVVWQAESVDVFRQVVTPYIDQAVQDNRRLIYIRFGDYPPLVPEEKASKIYYVDPAAGFESFAMRIHNIIAQEGLCTFYVFDCLTDLLEYWYSDLMIGNFFRVTCPFLYELDTVAYFCLIRQAHTYDTIALIRETTQLLLDLYTSDDNMYIHPLKVWERYSPTMFFPHLISGDEAVCITSSAEAAVLFSNVRFGGSATHDYWETTLEKAREAMYKSTEEQQPVKELLMKILIGTEASIFRLADRYFSLAELIDVGEREIGTGRIGGKSVGMLLARQILLKDAWTDLKDHWEPHDSYYLGADVFYTYIVQNGLWQLRARQKSEDGYFSCAPDLKEGLLKGTFPKMIREQFMQILEYFGQSPIIVRSSSLLEDNYGNAFAGKYDSFFLANQGTPDERYAAFEDAIRKVYASTMNEDALAYRKNRNLVEQDEQMAILIQRVSGDHHGDFFFPHAAGMGNSVNLYMWDKSLTPEAGMIRLVLGLGTRAVDRISEDYARIISLDKPGLAPLVNYGDEAKFSQHKIDCIDLKRNTLAELDTAAVAVMDIKTDKKLFFTPDYTEAARLRDLGYRLPTPQRLDFRNLLKSDFPMRMQQVMRTLESAYEYPVDIEFAVNFSKSGTSRLSLLQCRPLQTKGLGKPVEMPNPEESQLLFSTKGNFMGGNLYMSVDYVIFVNGLEYQTLSPQDKYQTARYIGKLNTILKNDSTLLIGPGRWGTTTPALGVPVHFTELCHMDILCEAAYRDAGMMPELSFGSHFFQDIVESDIFYAAIFTGDKNVRFNPDKILNSTNLFSQLVKADGKFNSVIHVAKPRCLEVYADVTSQELVCFES